MWLYEVYRVTFFHLRNLTSYDLLQLLQDLTSNQNVRSLAQLLDAPSGRWHSFNKVLET